MLEENYIKYYLFDYKLILILFFKSKSGIVFLGFDILRYELKWTLSKKVCKLVIVLIFGRIMNEWCLVIWLFIGFWKLGKNEVRREIGNGVYEIKDLVRIIWRRLILL